MIPEAILQNTHRFPNVRDLDNSNTEELPKAEDTKTDSKNKDKGSSKDKGFAEKNTTIVEVPEKSTVTRILTAHIMGILNKNE